MDANGPESLALGEPRAERQHPIDELLPVRVVACNDRAPLDPPGHLRRNDLGDRRALVPPGDERAPDHLTVGSVLMRR
jgi:hypothetical protein